MKSGIGLLSLRRSFDYRFQRDGSFGETIERNLVRVYGRVQNSLTSLAYYQERFSIKHHAAFLKFRKAAHPFGLEPQATDFSHLL